MTVTDGNLEERSSQAYAEGMNICAHCSRLIFLFALSFYSTELHHLSPRRPLASTPPTGKVPLKTDGTPDLLASGTGPDLPFSFLSSSSSSSSRRFQQFRWVSVSISAETLSECWLAFVVQLKKNSFCLFWKFNLIKDKEKLPGTEPLIQDSLYLTLCVTDSHQSTVDDSSLLFYQAVIFVYCLVSFSWSSWPDLDQVLQYISFFLLILFH